LLFFWILIVLSVIQTDWFSGPQGRGWDRGDSEWRHLPTISSSVELE